MKKENNLLVKSLFLLILTLFCLIGYNPELVKASNNTEVREIEIGLNESFPIEYDYYMSASYTPAFIYAEDEKFKGIREGTTIINLVLNDKNIDYKVTIKKAPSKITVKNKNVTLKNNKQYKIKYTLSSGAASNTIKYTSSNPDVAIVLEDGVIIPISKGSCKITDSSMSEYEKELVLHTSRTMYRSEDGLNHQGQVTFIVNTDNMTINNYINLFQENHVSHSFGQFVIHNKNGEHVLIDHGDAYPRSVVLQESTTSDLYDKVNLFNIPGDIGINSTGVSVGGIVESSNNYIVAMNSIDHSKATKYSHFEIEGKNTNQRDIILSVVPKDSLNESSVKQINIAKYSGTKKIGSVPYIVKVSDTRIFVLWQEFNLSNKDINKSVLKYVEINQNGNKVGDINEIKNSFLSSCQPIVLNNKIIWYTNEKIDRKIYSIDVN